MPNQITADGLEVKTYAELLAEFIENFKTIYGADINLSSDTPDGQIMNIFLQTVLDYQDLLVQVNAMFDPDQAVGSILDARCAINGIQRQAGTYTRTNITIVTTQALNLYGLDQEDQPIFTVADNAGNQFELLESISIGAAGSNVLAFRAKAVGAVLTVPNTITVPVSIVLGVSTINNPTTYTSLGINEETDAQFKIRRQKSVSLASQGYLAGLLASLLNISGVTSAFVYENVTGSTDGDGVPGHSIWVIVSGVYSAAAVANAIYTKRNAGCGMKGDITFNVGQPDGSVFTVRWDDVEDEALFIKFTATSLDGVNPPDIAAIRAGLPASYVPDVYAQVNINELSEKVQDLDSNTLVTAAGFCDTAAGSYTNTDTPSAKNKQFRFTEAKVIILPMILNPPTSTVVHAESATFAGLGGYGALVYSIQTNNSGGTIDAGTGEYTAGPTSPVTDTIRVTDSLGNYAEATVSVT